MSRPRLLTFDCYGTLIDWNRGLSAALSAEADRQGIAAGHEEILSAYHAAEPRVQSEVYRTYREVLTLLEAEIAGQLGWRPPATPGYLADSLPSWPPFADTNAALRQMVDLGFELGILSNIDDDLFAATRRHFEVDFGLVVTAQQVHGYKPGAAHFERALEAVGGDRGALLHIAQSYFHDIEPASRLGLETVWVNRLAEGVPDGGPRPSADVPDLAAAAAWLAGRYGSPAEP